MPAEVDCRGVASVALDLRLQRSDYNILMLACSFEKFSTRSLGSRPKVEESANRVIPGHEAPSFISHTDGDRCE